MKVVRRLFPIRVGLRGSVAHLFHEFQCTLGNRRQKQEQRSFSERREHISRIKPLDLDERQAAPRRKPELRVKQIPRVLAIVKAARERGQILQSEVEILREILVVSLSKEDCEEWLGYYELLQPQTGAFVGFVRRNYRDSLLASLAHESDLGSNGNIEKFRLHRAAALIDCFRPGVLDWQTPHVPDLELVLKFVELFTRPSIAHEEQRNLIFDLFNVRIPLEKIVQPERGPRVRPSTADLRYVSETREMSHEERAAAWDTLEPKPFQPFGRPNLEMYSDPKLQSRWRSAVNRLLAKARNLNGPDDNQGERELN